MAGRWLKAFEDFTKDLKVRSKELVTDDPLGSPLDMWLSQKLFMQHAATALEDGIHELHYLKSRQLGITTVSVALVDVFWPAMHPGIIGALVTDTEKNRDANRAMIANYVASYRAASEENEDFEIVANNKGFIKYSNGSRLDLLVAGTKKKSTAWGEGAGYAFAHCTEVASYGDADGLSSFMEALPQSNPHRLIVCESTAKGFNHWRNIWKGAEADGLTKRAFFIGWWASDVNRIERGDARFHVYGRSPMTGEERELIAQVKSQYGETITPEQLCWIRWKEATDTGDGGLLTQNQPWTAEQAFVITGYSFFQIRVIMQDMELIEADEQGLEYGYQAYRYEFGNSFFDMDLQMIEPGDGDGRQIELKIWEEPVEGGLYVIGCDPAFGRNDHKDRSVVEVYRCFADKMVQVAEFATADCETKHCAWVLAHLAGSYRNCNVIVEIGGPGRIIMLEWDHVIQLINAEQNVNVTQARDWEDALSQATWYLYNRPDSMGRGFAANFECLALDTRLPTPTGWTTMDEVQEGDYLLSDDGRPTRVVGLSDVKLSTKCYELTFDDGTVIVADENHWWKVARRHWRNGSDKLRQTKQLEAEKFYIRQASPLELPTAALPIDPYLLGVWLGDGTSESASMTCGDMDVEEMVANIEACGQPTRRTQRRGCWNVRFGEGRTGVRGGFLGRLRGLNLINNKHIPAAYLRASFDQRLALLQGLMDTDGTAGGNGGRQCAFSTTSEALVRGFSELVRSLGFKAKYVEVDESIYKPQFKNCSPKYQFWFTSYPDMPVFRLKRKLARVESSPRVGKNRQCHRIKSIKEVESVPVRCVMVDSPTRMFLAGDGMIPTHNTTWRTKQEIMFGMRGCYATKELVIRSMALLDEMRVVVQDGSEIGAPESRDENCKDDRVIATALCWRAWTNWRRPELLAQNMTMQRVLDEETGEVTNQARSLNGSVYRFFKTMEERAQLPAPRGPKWKQDRGLV